MNNRFTPCRAADWPWREEASEAVLMFHSKSWEPARRRGELGNSKTPNQSCLLFHQALFSWAASLIVSHAGFPLRMVLLTLWDVFAKGKFNSVQKGAWPSLFPLLFSLSSLFLLANPFNSIYYDVWWRNKEVVQSLHPLLFSLLKSSLLHQD